MAKFSVGVDIEEVHRFNSLIRNSRFLKRVFTPREIQYCMGKKNKSQHFAVRFAAKEAVWKALSEVLKNLNRTVSHNQVGIKNTAAGKPEVVLPPALSKWKKKISISLSHTNAYAVATAFVER